MTPSAPLTRPNTSRSTLKETALGLGASKASILPSSLIRIRQDLADLCGSCPNRGLARSCPPSVQGPAQFTRWISDYDLALFFCIDVETTLLLSSQRLDLFRILHEITADLEAEAGRCGFSRAMGFAGGSCKAIFCNDHPECSALKAPDRCRFPGRAKPSMSGFGIDVAALIKTAGWEKSSFLEGVNTTEGSAPPPPEPAGEKDLSGIYGLILLADNPTP